MTSGNETVNAVKWALEVYPYPKAGLLVLTAASRLAIERAPIRSALIGVGLILMTGSIDSAQMYHNEREVGSSIRQFLSSKSNSTSLKREDIHFTSKLASNTSYDAARRAIKQSIKQSGLDYIDLFLLHSPYGGKTKRLECWRAVEDAIDDGEVKIGGVSNFGVKHVGEPDIITTRRLVTASSYKSYLLRSPESILRSIKSKSTHLTPGPRSLRSANSMTSLSRHMRHLREHFA